MTSKLPKTVLALGAVSFFTDVSSEMIAPLLPQFVTMMGAGALFLGTLEGAADTTASFLKLLSGLWADRVSSKKPLVVLGYGLSSISRSLMWLATLPWHVLAIRLSDRVGKGIRTSPRDALLSNAVPSEARGRAFGFHRAADHAGAVFGPLFAMLLLWLGLALDRVFLIASVPALLAMLALIFFVPGRRIEAKPTQKENNDQHPKLAPEFKKFLVVVALFAIGNSPDSLLLLRAQELGLPPLWLPFLWAAFHVVKSLLSTPFGALSDKLGRKGILLGGFGIYALSYGLFAIAPNAIFFCVIFGLYGCYYAMTEGVLSAMVADLSPAASRGKAFGFYHATVGFCALPAGLLAGSLWTLFSPAFALLVGAGCAILASLLFALWFGIARR